MKSGLFDMTYVCGSVAHVHIRMQSVSMKRALSERTYIRRSVAQISVLMQNVKLKRVLYERTYIRKSVAHILIQIQIVSMKKRTEIIGSHCFASPLHRACRWACGSALAFCGLWFV